MLAGVRAWQSRAMPVTRTMAEQLSGTRFPGRRLALWVHLVENMLPLFDLLIDSGAEVLFGSCDATTADQMVVEYLRGRGARVLSDSSRPHGELLAEAIAWRPELVSEMGGELIATLLRVGNPPNAAMESTTTGIHRIRAAGALPIPVLNWNDLPLKQQVEHRFHVAEAVWTAFCALTGMGLLGRRVLVLGYGNVGKGVAAHARGLGAIVTVAEPDPIRRVDASLHGCEVVEHASLAAAHTEILVSATGRDGVVSAEVLDRLPFGAILVNAGHAPGEFDLNHLGRWPSSGLRSGITEYRRPGGRRIFVLGNASPLNLAYPHGSLGDDLWDPFNAVMMLGCGWLLDGSWHTAPAGLVEFPFAQQWRLAELMLARPRSLRPNVLAVADIAALQEGEGHELREVVGDHLEGSHQGHSLAHSTLRPGAVIDTHHHRVTSETFVIESGSGTVTLNGVATEVVAGQVVLVPPGTDHGFQAGEHGLSFWAVSTPSWTPADHRRR